MEHFVEQFVEQCVTGNTSVNMMKQNVKLGETKQDKD